MDLKEIGGKLAKLREERGLLQKEITGISRVTVGKMERGDGWYNIKLLFTYLEVLEVSLADFFK